MNPICLALLAAAIIAGLIFIASVVKEVIKMIERDEL